MVMSISRGPSALNFDRHLITRVRSSLVLWEEQTSFGPTSSLTGGGAIAALEERFASFTGSSFALGISSGTLALRTALAAVGVAHGERVIVPALDWPAAVAAVMSLGATPLPVDVGRGSFLLDPGELARRLDCSVAAVVVTHVAGVPADLRGLHETCRAAGVPLVEDCCQALGARLDCGSVGTIGDVGVFSFGPGKLIDAGEGGILVTNDAEIYARAVSLSQHPVRHLRSGAEPNHVVLAARLHPAAAIVAFAGLSDIERALDLQRRTAQQLLDRSKGLPGVTVVGERPGHTFSWSAVPAFVEHAGVRALADAGIGAEPLGAYDIAALLDSTAAVPNARAALRTVFRLYDKASKRPFEES